VLGEGGGREGRWNGIERCTLALRYFLMCDVLFDFAADAERVVLAWSLVRHGSSPLPLNYQPFLVVIIAIASRHVFSISPYDPVIVISFPPTPSPLTELTAQPLTCRHSTPLPLYKMQLVSEFLHQHTIPRRSISTGTVTSTTQLCVPSILLRQTRLVDRCLSAQWTEVEHFRSEGVGDGKISLEHLTRGMGIDSYRVAEIDSIHFVFRSSYSRLEALSLRGRYHCCATPSLIRFDSIQNVDPVCVIFYVAFTLHFHHILSSLAS
jgi:hypothetical protein